MIFMEVTRPFDYDLGFFPCYSALEKHVLEQNKQKLTFCRGFTANLQFFILAETETGQ